MADMISSTARSAVRFTSSMTGFTSTTSIESMRAAVADHLHGQVRFAIGGAAAHRRADAGRVGGIHEIHIERKMEARGAGRRRCASASSITARSPRSSISRMVNALTPDSRTCGFSSTSTSRSPTTRDVRGIHHRARIRRCRVSSRGPMPTQQASGMPCTLPLGVVSGVFMSACASIQSRPTFCSVLAEVLRHTGDACRWRWSGRRPSTSGTWRRRERFSTMRGRAAAGGGDLRQILGVARPGGQALGLLDRDIAQVLDLVADRGQPLVQIGDAEGGGAHIHAAASCPRSRGAPMIAISDCAAFCSYGRVRYSMRGNAIVSRRWSIPQIHVTQRSMPMPNPACGTVPYLRRSRYQSNASFGSLCSSIRWIEQVVIVDALAAADDLAVAFRREHVHSQRQLRPLRVGLEVERFDLGREPVHQQRTLLILRQDASRPCRRNRRPTGSRCPCSAESSPRRRSSCAETAPGSFPACSRPAPASSVLRGGSPAPGRQCRPGNLRPAPSRLPASRTPSPAPPSRTPSDGGASSTSRRGTSDRNNTPCRTPSPSLRYKAGPIASGTPYRPRSSPPRKASSCLRRPPG